MKILGIESSAITASAAIVSDNTVTAEYTVNDRKTHSQTLLPMIQAICDMTETDIQEIDFIAISAGPGSFTGLRIGGATAKGIGLALDIPIVAVPTLEAMAYNYKGLERLICPMLDARRTQVYTGLYKWTATGELVTVLKQSILKVSDLVDIINELKEDIIFLGDGIEPNRDFIDAYVKTAFRYADANNNTQRASSVALAGRVLYEKGKAVKAGEYLPDYLRPSQAERELGKK